MVDYQDRLRSLALHDEQLIAAVLAAGDDSEMSGLDRRTHALVCLGGLLAIGAARSSYQCQVDAAFAAGASEDDIVGTLIAIAPTVGVARVVAVAPDLALAVGYDVDEAFETLNGESEHQR